jgi:hypothetical protein
MKMLTVEFEASAVAADPAITIPENAAEAVVENPVETAAEKAEKAAQKRRLNHDLSELIRTAKPLYKVADLIEQGADVNGRFNGKPMVLHIVNSVQCEEKHKLALLEFFAGRKADFNALDQDGHDASWYAEENSFEPESIRNFIREARSNPATALPYSLPESEKNYLLEAARITDDDEAFRKAYKFVNVKSLMGGAFVPPPYPLLRDAAETGTLAEVLAQYPATEPDSPEQTAPEKLADIKPVPEEPTVADQMGYLGKFLKTLGWD